MTDLPTFTEENRVPIHFYQHLSLENFRLLFSSPTNPSESFSDPIGHFTTNEYDYPKSLNQISVRGGIHLAVMGGLDPVLGQIAVAQPDLTLVVDINPLSLQNSLAGRLQPIKDSQDGEEYWQKVLDYFMNTVRKIDPTRWDFPIEQDISRGGWSSKQFFILVKDAVNRGKVKFASADITHEGLDLALRIAKKTGVPVRLIYISNIFDYQANDETAFKQKLGQTLEQGLIDPTAQVIGIDLPRKASVLVTDVWTLTDYLNSSTP